jgi:UDP-N-acetylmuramate-alanine ligase
MELTKEEKIAIINQHYKASVENTFDIQLNLIQENAIQNPNQDIINALNNNLEIEKAKQQALNEQIYLLNQ